MAYERPAGDSLAFALAGAYTAPAGDALDFSLPSSAPEPPPPWELPRGLANGTSLPWQQGTRRDHHYRGRWRDTVPSQNHLRTAWDQATAMPAGSIRIPAGQLTVLAGHNRQAWARLFVAQQQTSTPWASPAAKEGHKRLPWGPLPWQDQQRLVPYLAPPPKDNRKALAFEDTQAHADLHRRLPYGQPPPKDRRHRTVWGRLEYERICLRLYRKPPGNGLDFVLAEPAAPVPAGNALDFAFDRYTYDERCTHREASGIRDQYILVPPVPRPVAPLNQRVYRLMNNAMLTRVSDLAPVEITDMQLQLDRDSWSWGFSATLPTAAALALVKPGSAGPVEVEASINGWLWRVLVEKYQRTRTFGKSGWTVTGRSVSCQLAEPYAPARSRLESAARTAVQLAEDELTNTGWTLVWQLPDWLVPGGAFAYDGLTPLQAVQRVVEAAGGVLQSATAAKQLIAMPRRKISPWSWATATPDLLIPEGVLFDASGEWRPAPAYNGVYVSGTTQGVLCKVKRTGSAGDLLAPMVTDALITEVAVAQERGRAILSDGGQWSIERLTTPLFSSPDTPGLTLPGSLIEVYETADTWRGQVISCAITASRQQGLEVRQSLEVERYYG